MSLILPGRELELAYPTCNSFRLHKSLEFVERRVKVTTVRDFSHGLPIKFFLRRPLIRRGRMLVAGIDSDARAVRRFWLEAQRGGELPEYRLGLYDPKAPGELVDWVGRIFGPTEQEQLRMRKVALRWLSLVRERGDSGLRLAAYPGIW